MTVFLGRCSTKDQQDPRLSIPGQAAVCAGRLEAGTEFDQFFWDVESGYHELANRGMHDDDYYAELSVPLRRDGSVNDLLVLAEAGKIARVICERSDRAARDLLTILTVEQCLDRWGVELIYATEPQLERPGVMSAAVLRMRRGQQTEAEVFKRTMMEQSMRGQREHAAQGYSHGCPPYPYEAYIDTATPKQEDRFMRRPKRRLRPHSDVRRWDAARRFAELRLHEGAEYNDIRVEANAQPQLFPHNRRGALWRSKRIRDLLLNPRLTGYAVFNRRSSANRFVPIPIQDWVWSREPSHEAVFTVVEWKELMRLDTVGRTPRTPFERLQAAIHDHGLALTTVRSDNHHVVYRIADRQITVPRSGRFPDAAVDRVIDWIENQA